MVSRSARVTYSTIRSVAERLTDRRLKVTRHPWGEPTAAGDPAALVLLAPEQADPAVPINRLAFRWLQHAAPKLRAAGRQGGAVLASVARLDGAFGLADLSPDASPDAGGLAGLVKATAGEIEAAVAGTDYQEPLEAGTDYQAPLAEQAAIADAGSGTEIATINAILAALRTLGLVAASA